MNKNVSALTSEMVYRFNSGPKRIIRWILDRFLDAAGDRRLAISSTRRRSALELHFASEDSVEYQAISYRDIEELLNFLQPGSDDVFLDLGCGMGRAVCLASTWPMREVIGVEISPELCDIARENINRMSTRAKCGNMRIVECDAATYVIPTDVTILYMFNPFRGATLTQVLHNLYFSFRDQPRSRRVVFYGTVSTRFFDSETARHPWLGRPQPRVLRSGATVLIYRINPISIRF